MITTVVWHCTVRWTLKHAGTPTNVALNKPANQSSTSFSHFSASAAVNPNTPFCTQTLRVVGVRAWWQVDLGSSYNVTSVTISSTGDCTGKCGK